MSEPIKVTRAQWDAALEDARTAAFVEVTSGREQDMVYVVVEEILGPRPAPDTPPDLDRDANRRVARDYWTDTGRDKYPVLTEAFLKHLIDKRYSSVDLSDPDDLALVRRTLVYEAEALAEIARRELRGATEREVL